MLPLSWDMLDTKISVSPQLCTDLLHYIQLILNPLTPNNSSCVPCCSHQYWSPDEAHWGDYSTHNSAMSQPGNMFPTYAFSVGHGAHNHATADHRCKRSANSLQKIYECIIRVWFLKGRQNFQ